MFDLSGHRYRFRIVIPAYPAFNIYSHIAVKTTALGPVCVASAANKMAKWDVEVIDENNLGRFGPVSETGGADHEFLQLQRPADVVGLYGGLTSTIPRLYQMSQFYKNKGVVTIAGGQHFVEDNISEAFSRGIDYIVFGEAEEAITELLEAIETGRDAGSVKGIAYVKDGKIIITAKREALTDFDKLPLPDFSLVRYANMKIYPVERIRGCGMDCEFCTVRGKPRHAEPERLLEHIASLVETRNAKHFFIVDDLFGQQRDETIRLCNLLADYERRIRRRLDITVQIRLDKARDTELLSAMQRAGVQTVAIGFESPIDAELKAMNKHMSSSEMVSWARVFRKFGFLVHGMFIFGYPLKEKIGLDIPVEERVRGYKNFIARAKIDTVQVMLPVPLPGTELRQRLSRQNRIYPRQDIGWEYYDGNFPLFEPDEPMTAEQIHTCAKKIMGRFYRFKYMFLIAVNTFSFPAIIFFLHNIQLGWQKWYRPWRNSLIRFGGWIVLKKWTTAFRRNNFLQKLQNAHKHLTQAR
ncbi:MAG: radical SAM protein [Phycisphaerae bacterium]